MSSSTQGCMRVWTHWLTQHARAALLLAWLVIGGMPLPAAASVHSVWTGASLDNEYWAITDNAEVYRIASPAWERRTDLDPPLSASQIAYWAPTMILTEQGEAWQYSGNSWAQTLPPPATLHFMWADGFYGNYAFLTDSNHFYFWISGGWLWDIAFSTPVAAPDIALWSPGFLVTDTGECWERSNAAWHPKVPPGEVRAMQAEDWAGSNISGSMYWVLTASGSVYHAIGASPWYAWALNPPVPVQDVEHWLPTFFVTTAGDGWVYYLGTWTNIGPPDDGVGAQESSWGAVKSKYGDN